MERAQIADAVELEEIPNSFICCVCLDLLYKPVVLSCGHISCFWCVHKSMNGLRQSNCPICRNPYNHFPAVSQMLHLLLLKMFPVAYKKREEQILEEEKTDGLFSPQFDSNACGSHNYQECEPLNGLPSPSTSCIKSDEISGLTKVVTSEGMDVCQNKLHGNCNRISIADALCVSCKHLLYHPVFLNCGHVYCQSCVVNPVEDTIRCLACESLQPKSFPKVCLELDKFLEEQFPEDYALRRDAVKLKEVNFKTESSASSETENHLQSYSNPHTRVHFGVGCDFCGMYPVVGDRYRCKDCPEKIGFDLCSNCYHAGYNLPGRFNQQHTPEHKLELIKSDAFPNIVTRLGNGRLVNITASLIGHLITSEVSEDESPAPTVSDDASDTTHNGLVEDGNDSQSSG